MQLVATGVHGLFEDYICGKDTMVPYNAQKGDVLNPTAGKVPTKYQWQTEVQNKITEFGDIQYSTQIPRDITKQSQQWQLEINNKIKTFDGIQYTPTQF